MRILYPFLFAWFLLATIPDGHSQYQTQTLKAEVELQGNRVKITYDISGTSPGDAFSVWIEITDASGKSLTAKSLKGDVGNNVSAGAGKEVLWDHVEDGVNLDVGIYIQVFAKPVESPVVDPRAGTTPAKKEMKTGALVLQSLVFPGLGLSRATGQPHWIKGVAGYACIGSAIAFNIMTVNSYEEYRNESDITISDELFEKALQQDQVSEIFAYAAIGIWVTDIIWNLVGASKLTQSPQADGIGFSIKPGFDPQMQAPVLALRYRF